MAEAVLGLGSNLGARRSILRAAELLLDAWPGSEVLARSALYETPPLGPPQPDYLNAALRVRWAGDLDGLLEVTQHLEQLLGRERRERWGARTLDIDVLHWSEGAVRRVHIEVPHRELQHRPFALAPLLDVAPELAPVWEPVLQALKGAPPHARPGWPRALHEAGSACSEWLCDAGELLAIAGELVAREGASSVPALDTRRFTLASELPLAGQLTALSGSIAAAFEQGFAVRAVALTTYGADGVAGLLLGEPRAQRVERALPEVCLERRVQGEMRVRILPTAPDHSPDPSESGTM